MLVSCFRFCALPLLIGCSVGGRGAPPHPTYQAYAVSYGTLRGFPLRGLVLGADSTERVDIAMTVWVLRGQDRVVLVDAGFYRDEFLASWEVEDFVKPSEAVARFGVRPEDVTDIVISHMHWDHVDGADLFPNARVWVQQAEYEYYADSTHLPRSGVFASDVAMLREIERAGRLQLVPGDSSEIAPGIVAFTGGRHTHESQYVSARLEGGATAVFASDNLYLYANLERRRPIAATWDTVSNLAAQDRMRRLASSERLIVPGHDLAVFSRFADAGPGAVRIQ